MKEFDENGSENTPWETFLDTILTLDQMIDLTEGWKALTEEFRLHGVEKTREKYAGCIPMILSWLEDHSFP